MDEIHYTKIDVVPATHLASRAIFCLNDLILVGLSNILLAFSTMLHTVDCANYGETSELLIRLPNTRHDSGKLR